MKTIKFGALVGLLLAGCGGDLLGADGGTSGGDTDLAITLYRLQSGTYKTTAITNVNDGCALDPLGATDPELSLIGSMVQLTNDGNGNIQLGSLKGTPAEPTGGASCPGEPANPACATATNPLPFDNNEGTLVSDNTQMDTDVGACAGDFSWHQHVENLLHLTADNTFTADFTITQSDFTAACATTCTSTWTRDYVKQ